MSQAVNPAFQAEVALAIGAQTIASATDTDGTGIDMSKYDKVAAVVQFGNVTASSGTVLVKLQESATVGGTYTDIAGATTAALTLADAIDNKRVCLYFDGRRRNAFVRVRIVSAGTVTGCPITFGVFMLGGAQKSIDPAVAYHAAAAGDPSG